jgi:hypothetical protein
VLTLVERALPSGVLQSDSVSGARAEAVRRMRDFGDKYHLSLGEPVTRAQLHEEAFLWPPQADPFARSRSMLRLILIGLELRGLERLGGNA